jgi:hypothetical protein
MAGATAFLQHSHCRGPIILIQVFGLVLSPRFMTRQLFFNIGEMVGKNTAGELHKTLFNVRHHFSKLKKRRWDSSYDICRDHLI